MEVTAFVIKVVSFFHEVRHLQLQIGIGFSITLSQSNRDFRFYFTVLFLKSRSKKRYIENTFYLADSTPEKPSSTLGSVTKFMVRVAK